MPFVGVDPQTLFLDERGGVKGCFQSFYVYFVGVDWKYICGVLGMKTHLLDERNHVVFEFKRCD